MRTTVLDRIFAEKLEQGIEQERAEEARLLLRRYLEHRFGTIPPALDARIAAAGASELDALSPPPPSTYSRYFSYPLTASR